AHRGEPGIDEEHAVAARLDGDVAASTDEHVDVSLHVERVDLSARSAQARRRHATRAGRVLPIRGMSPARDQRTEREHAEADRDEERRSPATTDLTHVPLPSAPRSANHRLTPWVV